MYPQAAPGRTGKARVFSNLSLHFNLTPHPRARVSAAAQTSHNSRDVHLFGYWIDMAALESAMPKGTSGGRLGPAVVSYDAAVVPSPTLPSVDVIKCK